MKKLSRTIDLSGGALAFCCLCCEMELFDEATTAEYEKKLADGFEPGPLTQQALRRYRAVVPGAMRKPWPKRADWLAQRCDPDLHFRIWRGFSVAFAPIRKADTYRVSTRWHSSLLAAMFGVGWPEAKRALPAGDSELFDASRLATGMATYLDWVRLGGSIDLPRWLAHFYASGGESIDELCMA